MLMSILVCVIIITVIIFHYLKRELCHRYDHIVIVARALIITIITAVNHIINVIIISSGGIFMHAIIINITIVAPGLIINVALQPLSRMIIIKHNHHYHPSMPSLSITIIAPSMIVNKHSYY